MGRPRLLILPPEELRRMTAEGYRLKKIAARFGCSAQTVLNRMREAGIQAHPKHSNPGHLNPSWKNGRYLDSDGYVLVYAPEHPNADKANRVREHRLVAEQMIGRYLTAQEVVDHIDGNKSNNAPSNLRVFPRNAEHLAETLKGRVPLWTEDGKRRIREGGRLAALRRKQAIPGSTKTDDLPSR